MRAMMTGFAAIVLIGVGAYYALDQAGFSSEQVYSNQNVRLD